MSRARTSRGRVLAYTMIVADSECHAEIKGYLPFTRGGVAGPETREEHREGQARRGPRGPSAFIPVEEILREGAEGLEQHLGLEALMSSGRVDNLAVVMGLHPDYLSSFWRLHYLLLHTDGPLASSWRHYIAIMVSLSGLGACRGDQMVVPASDSFGDSRELIFFFF